MQSEGLLGAVVYNLFSVGIEKRRLPLNWKWIAPGQETSSGVTSSSTSPTCEDSDFDSDRENFRPVPPATTTSLHLGLGSTSDGTPATNPAEEDDISAGSGFFQTPSGRRVRGVIRFGVRDVDVIPGSEREKGFISIEGTMLKPEEERKLVEEERHRAGGSSRKNSDSQGNSRQENGMSGAVPSANTDTGGVAPTTEASTRKRREKRSKKSGS
ncbi:hypothetical protein AJ80_05029 [Polytolypa hystricis UAMH7299]|uniref:RPA43 OB domain-containing protein n=1 Tax=Polytolypa hystricis (strain UAMH7299) TaxID=1447883 RepID=A0A2B7Y6P4_POLH7|nr:hypothetical protein AJ80_05029 [Polytolypa hystricis UAMH7299]